MKQLAMAFHTFADANGSFPAAYTADKDGKKLLSWRVAVLPYLGEKELFEEFHQDEPWDSEHNQKLIERMPEVFKNPTARSRGQCRQDHVPGSDRRRNHVQRGEGASA